MRRSYIELVKMYHPDSGHQNASAEKFQELDEAFKILMEKYAKARRNIEMDLDDEVKVFDIRHTAPQHRQYLTYGGFGIGTPAQREKQFQQRRAMKAQETVLEYRLQKNSSTGTELIKKDSGGDHFKKHAIKTKYGFDRVVEDLIQEAMAKGDFQNLSCAGKPLKDLQSQNPYVDFTTHKINKILLDNGFVPEWITMQKEIRGEIEKFKDDLRVERSKLGFPLEPSEETLWNKRIENFQSAITNINKSIDKFNLIVPMLDKQMFHIQLKQIADKIKAEKPVEQYIASDEPKLESSAPSDYKINLLSLIDDILKSYKKS